MEPMKNDLQSATLDDESIQAQALVWKLIYGFADSLTLKCAIELGLADILHKHGHPMTLSNIAQELAMPSPDIDRLHRIMRFLVHIKLFAVEGDGDDDDSNGTEKKYALTTASKLLVRAEEKNMASFALLQLYGDEMGPWHYLARAVEGDTTPWMACHKKPCYEVIGNDPEYNKIYNAAMDSHTSFVVTALVEGCRKNGVLDVVRRLVDVGGNTGKAAKGIAKAFPHIKCTVMDLAHVVESQPADPVVDFVAGDVFDHIPQADAVMMKSLLHGFNDDDCVKILNKCKEAIPTKGGKVIMVEVVVDIEGTPEFKGPRLCMDFVSGLYGGKERTKKEWKNLMGRAGFSSYKIIPLVANEAIIEAYP